MSAIWINFRLMMLHWNRRVIQGVVRGSSCVCLGATFILGNTEAISGNAHTISQDGHIEKVSLVDCPDLSGTYKLHGEALPGMAPYFRIRSIGLALDTMLGLDIKVPERQHATEIQILHTDTKSISLKITASPVVRTLQLQATDKMWCQDHMLFIERMVDTRGEAVTGQALVIHQFELVKDEALILKTEIKGRGRFLFFEINDPPEFYGARFQVKQ